MRTLFLALATSATILATGATGAAAGVRYCMQGDDFAGAAGDCSFASYQQCQVAAAGRTASCGANPWLPIVVPTNRTRLRDAHGRQ